MFVDKLAFEASAGSGKTFNLVVRYLSLLFMGASANKILALTFTNKAAAEMQERIIETLQELEHKYELEVISEVTGIDKNTILEQRKAVLDAFLTSDSKIYTLDKFFAKILRKFSLHVGIMPDFSSFASQHEIKLMARFLNEVSVSGVEKSLINLSLMSSKHLSDIFFLLEELYVKSKELPSTNVYAPQNYHIYEREALDALNALRTFVLNEKSASASAKKAVAMNDYESLVKATWLQKESCQEYSYFKKFYSPAMDTLLFQIQDAVLKRMQTYEEQFLYELNRLLKIYVHSKMVIAKDEGELSFNDITSLVYQLLREDNNIDSDFLYFRLDSDVEHIMLDEFQDTSILQYEILAPILDEITAGKGVSSERSLFFVGDVKQSIYRFRGGVSALFYEVANKYEVKVDALVTNYRSEAAVVNFVNQTFADKIKNYHPQKVKANASQGYCEVIKNDETLQSMHACIVELLNLGADVNSIAVLTATNGDGQSVAEHLRSVNIDVVTETTSLLIKQKKVQALIEYFKYAYFQELLYKHNFFALIEQEVAPLLCLDFSKYTLLQIAHIIISKFSLFEGDKNILRFLNILTKYKDVEQLLFEYEQIDEVAAQSDLQGVRVLTIHKSKGLEFEHVVLIDRLKKIPPSRAPIIYEYEGIQLQRLYLRMRGREALDKQYQQALYKEALLSKEDSLNALYVAFTRAEKSLFIIEKSKGSLFEILDLEAKKYGSLEITRQTKKLSSVHKVTKYKNLYYGTQSDILTAEKEDVDSLHAIEFGIALHYMLEMLQAFDTNSLQSAYVALENRFLQRLNISDLQEVYKRVALLVETAKFLHLCEGTIYKEQGFSFEGEVRYMDLLIQKADGSHVIIDYKSSLLYQDKHRKQVAFYKYAVEKIHNVPVSAYLCYLLEDEIKIVKI